ncbi:MAG: anthranilate synthase component I family protein [Phycisphaerae bacterium]|nr:anthranilate synthase component I family protein [Phycisphaerae bacterium]
MTQPALQPHWNMTPQDALAHWPSERPLAALITGAVHERWGRMSVLAQPSETHTIAWPGHGADACRTALRELERTLASHAWFEVDATSASAPSQASGLWIVSLAYEWGGLVEPSAMPRHRPPPDGWPLAVLAWCPHPLVYLHAERSWHAQPEAHELGELLHARAHAARAMGAAPSTVITHLESDEPRASFERAVARTVEYIHAGDIFQANVAQRFSARWRGSTRAIARAAFDAGEPRYGAYLETPTHALASMSPELFLRVERSGAAISRPIKGTLPSHERADTLLASGKDAAELHMIVDLMRNDLGRLCVPGSVRVDQARALESHATVHHAVAEISAHLRSGTSLLDVLRATWPPGSVTGVPKVRALQVIDELEPVSRGPYCGAIGAVSLDALTLNVGIRTICMHRDAPGVDEGTLRYSAGCGIVAESVPGKEYEESLHKTAVMLHAAHALRGRSAARGEATRG